MKRTAIVIGTLMLAACGSQNTGKECPGASGSCVVNLEAGGKLFACKCSACHKLPDVKAHSDKDWAAQVDRMVCQKGAKLTPDEHKLVVQYLQSSNCRD